MKRKFLPLGAFVAALVLAGGALAWVNTSVSASHTEPTLAGAAAQASAEGIKVAQANPAAAAPAPAPEVPAVKQPAAGPAAPATDGPRIFSPAPEFNFGAVDNAQKIQHDFIIQNVGTAPLEIASVKTSCGCTVAELKKKTLAPGEETNVSATLSNSGKQGLQTKHLTVESNDPAQRLYRLTMTGTAVASINVEPRSVTFGKVVDDAPLTQTIKVNIEKSRRPVKITGVTSSAPDKFAAELKTVEEGGEYEVVVRTAGPLAPGPHRATLSIQTDDPKNPAISAQVTAQVVGELEVMPQQLSVRTSEREGETSSQYLRVTAGRVKEFEIKEVVPPLESMAVDVQQRAKNDYLINVKNMPMDGSLDGKQLIIRTNLENKPEISVPFVVAKPLRRDIPPRAQAVPAPSAPAAAPAPAQQ